MALIGRTFSLGQVSASADRELYEYLNLYNQSVLDIGNHMKLTTSANTITVGDGACIVQGAYIQNTTNLDVDVSGKSSGYIVITIDLSNPNTNTGTPGSSNYNFTNNQLKIEAVTSIVQQPLRNGGTIYMQPLCSFVNVGGSITINQNQEMINFYDYTTKHTNIGISSAGSISATDIEIINAQGQTITKLSDELQQLNTKISNLESDTGWVIVPANGANYQTTETSLIRKVGKVVTLILRAKTANNIAEGALVQATIIPEQFRPAASLYFNNVAVNTSIAFSNFDCMILTGGQINLRCKSGALTKELVVQGTLTWMVD